MTRQRTRREIEAQASKAGGEDMMLMLLEVLLDVRAELRDLTNGLAGRPAEAAEEYTMSEMMARLMEALATARTTVTVRP